MIQDLRFKNKKIAVIGRGVEGQSSARWLKKHGAVVTVLDQKDDKDYLTHLDQYDVIVRSPGVKRSTIQQALPQNSKAEITSQTKLFFDLCPGKIIGITGTKGKGTTAALMYEMLKEDGQDLPAGRQGAYLGGNIGKPMLNFLDNLSDHSMVVLELSSFQLQDLTKSPHIAVILMITSEHLDYHKDTIEYVEAKRNLLRFQIASDAAVINKDYPASHESDIHTAAKVFLVSREGEVKDGCFVRDGKIVVRAGPAASETPDEIEIIDTKDIKLLGKHNWENVCAAVMAALCVGVSKQSITSVLKTFQGLPHRLQFAGEINGVRYYDDSFSTTPETAIAAIEAFDAPKILILGGSGKGSDFTELGDIISKSKSIKAIIGIGVEWKRIKSAFGSQRLAFRMVEGCNSMKEIVLAAWKIAIKGDVVLLSPACASFDMFTNYKDRGEQFKREVLELSSKLKVKS